MAFAGSAAVVVVVGLLIALATREKPPPAPREPSAARLSPALLKRTEVTQAPAPSAAVSPVSTAAPGESAEWTGPTTGCGAPAPFEGVGWMSSTNDLDPQKWLVYVPRGYDPNRRHPLIVLFHDDSSNPAEVLRNTQLGPVADTHGLIIAAPADPGLMYVWTKRSGLAAAARAAKETTERLCIDDTRQVLVGHASGSIAAESLSCEAWVDGIVLTSFVAKSKQWSCVEPRPVPTLFIAPTRSGFTPPQGGNDCTGAYKLPFTEVQALWEDRNSCSGSKKVWFEHEDGVCRTEACSEPFIFCEVDGGRRWPGSPPRPMDVLDCDGPDSKFPLNGLVTKFVNELRRD